MHSVHPGYVEIDIFKAVDATTGASRTGDPVFRILSAMLSWFGVDPQQGCLAIYNAATAVEFGLRTDGADDFRGGARYFNRL